MLVPVLQSTRHISEGRNLYFGTILYWDSAVELSCEFDIASYWFKILPTSMKANTFGPQLFSYALLILHRPLLLLFLF
jgi:hypothetical protein